MSNVEFKTFRLTENFLSKYEGVQPDWGFNGLGHFVYMRTYSRVKEDGTNEEWWETVRRVVEGTYNIQKRWILGNRMSWSEIKAQYSAQEMYDRIFNMKFLPPGRGLWAMGTAITEERQLFAALNNCSFIYYFIINRSSNNIFTYKITNGSLFNGFNGLINISQCPFIEPFANLKWNSSTLKCLS